MDTDDLLSLIRARIEEANTRAGKPEHGNDDLDFIRRTIAELSPAIQNLEIGMSYVRESDSDFFKHNKRLALILADTKGDLKLLATKLTVFLQSQEGREMEINISPSNVIHNHVNATSSSSAQVSSSISNSIEVINSSSDLTEEEKKGIELALYQMKSAAETGDASGFADKLINAINIANKAASVIPTLVTAAGSIASLF